ncbi:MAG: hypothetical protein ACE5E5_10505 [Phycisphaerae bacterium]
MKNFAHALSYALLLALLAGCDGLGSILDIIDAAPTTVGVSFVNTTDFPVDVEFFTSDEDQILRDLLTNDNIGNLTAFVVPAGETVDLPPQSCDELQAMTIDNAELRILGGLGPSEQAPVLRDGENFSCGDRVTFTFRSADVADLSIGTSFAPLTEATP